MIAPLTRVSCGDCLGDGYAIAHPGDWEEAFTSCPTCSGFGEIETCSACNTTPQLADGLEVCECDPQCEFCGAFHTADQMIWGSCLSCFDAAYTRYAAEMGEPAINGYGRAA